MVSGRKFALFGLIFILSAGVAFWTMASKDATIEKLPAQSNIDAGNEANDGSNDFVSPSALQTNTSGTKLDPMLEPADIRAFRDARGYYGSGGNDIGAKHPYEYLDDETLQGLADQQDGLAQLVLADRISNSDIETAMPLYLEAAVNGKTAALINAASSQLVVENGKTGFAFELTDEEGLISDEYAEILQYYAAAEALGDFVGSEMLMEHISAANFGDDSENISRICSDGIVLARNIENIRYTRWGERSDDDVAIESLQVPQSICGHRN